MTSGPSQSCHRHSSAVKRLPSTALTNRCSAPLTLEIASLKHHATHRPVPWAPRPRHWSSVVVSPPTEHHHRGDVNVVSLHPPYRLPRVPLGIGFLPGTTFSGESSPASRNRLAEPRRWRGIKSPVLVCWAERLRWAKPFPLGGSRALCIEPGCTVLFIIFHPIYSNQFNSNSNLVWTLEIHRSLTKFNKSIISIL
jgi:hypothetical protein